MSQQHVIKSTTSGAGYFFQGLKLVTQPGIRRFVIIPLIINILLLGGAFATLLTHLSGWIDGWLSYLPSWLEWLSYVL